MQGKTLIPEGNKAKTFGAASAMVPHDTGIRTVSHGLKSLLEIGVCHFGAQIAHKDVKVVRGVFRLLFLEGPLDAKFL